MTKDAIPGNVKKNRRGLLWKAPLGGLVLLLLAFAVFRFVVHQRVQNRLNAIRAAGYPATLQELNAWYAYPEGPNAADVYQRALNAIPINERVNGAEGVPIVGFVSDYVWGQPLDEKMTRRAKAYLSLRSDVIALLEEAASIEGCRFTRDEVDSRPAANPMLGEMRRAARIMLLQSVYDAGQNNYGRAIDRCLTILAMGQAIGSEPVHISSLVSASLQSMAYYQIESLLNTGRVSDEKLREVIQEIEPIDVYQLAKRAMIGERCFIRMLADPESRNFDRFDLADKRRRALSFTARLNGTLDIDRGYYLDAMQEYIDYIEHPIWPTPKAMGDVDRVPENCFMTRELIPVLTATVEVFVRAEAHRRVVLAGIAVERYRQQQGSLPATLEGLVPNYLDAVPEDPFTGGPLRYRAQDAGAIIYSVGADQTDNSGRWRDRRGVPYQDGTDIPFTFGGLQEKLWPRRDNEDDQSE